jgi:Zn-dependent protease
MYLLYDLEHHNYAAIFARIIALAIGISVHEFAHAKFADLAGDPTPRKAGRVTLNPLAHYDPIGSTLILIGFFGWGKPVPVNSAAFRHPRQDSLRVALGGIGANIVTAGLFGLVFRTGIIPDVYAPLVVEIVFINLLLAFFNLLPLYPLDGSHALLALLPLAPARRVRDFYMRFSMGPLMLLIMASFLVPQVFMIVMLPVSLLSWVFTGQQLSFM